MTLKKETAGTIVYEAEPTDDGLPPKVRTLYVAKFAAGKQPPTSITITVTNGGA